jgi:hypothetical protein
MDERELYHRLVSISDVDDFVLELKPCHSKSYWGRYFPDRKLIRLYALDEFGEQYDDAILLKEGLHELTHHIQYNHIPFWTRVHGVMHDDEFWEIYRGMLQKAFRESVDDGTKQQHGCISTTEDGRKLFGEILEEDPDDFGHLFDS